MVYKIENKKPNFGTYYLVYGTDKSMYDTKRWHVAEMDDLEDGMEFNETGFFYWLTEKGTKIEDVTHWTELPTIENVLEYLTTDYLFDELLPPFVNIDGKLYHFETMFGKRGVHIKYKTETGDYLGQTWREGKTLREASLSMIHWLFKFDYIKYTPFGYREKYENIFNVKIEHSRDF